MKVKELVQGATKRANKNVNITNYMRHSFIHLSIPCAALASRHSTAYSYFRMSCSNPQSEVKDPGADIPERELESFIPTSHAQQPNPRSYETKEQSMYQVQDCSACYSN